MIISRVRRASTVDLFIGEHDALGGDVSWAR
jgi:hypothetical protein